MLHGELRDYVAPQHGAGSIESALHHRGSVAPRTCGCRGDGKRSRRTLNSRSVPVKWEVLTGCIPTVARTAESVFLVGLMC